jgi:RNA polymerase sigma-70 factor (ECF subfamily)
MLASKEKQRINNLEDLYNGYSKYMMNIAFYMLNSKEDAEDALHNAFIKLSKHINLLIKLKEYQLMLYLKMTIKNTSIDIIKSKKEFVFIEDLDNELVSFVEVEKIILKKKK